MSFPRVAALYFPSTYERLNASSDALAYIHHSTSSPQLILIMLPTDDICSMLYTVQVRRAEASCL